jgi:hypothetical protein
VDAPEGPVQTAAFEIEGDASTSRFRRRRRSAVPDSRHRRADDFSADDRLSRQTLRWYSEREGDLAQLRLNGEPVFRSHPKQLLLRPG